MIRLVSVIGHGKELIPHFIKHYSNYVDEIQLVIYETDLYNNLTKEVSELIKGNEKVKIVKTIKDRIFDWEKVTQLYNFIKSKSPNDWWVIADVDEFHLYPNDNLKQLISNCNEHGWDIVRGGFIDRIGRGGEFTELVEDTPIWEQFPNAGFFRYPLSRACPNKICITKGYVEITSGQHYAKIDGHTTWRWQGWNHPLINPHSFVQVHHFKWDKTSINRIKAVAELRKDYSYSEEYSRMFVALSKTKFKINVDKTEFMFELGLINPNFDGYRKWNKLIKKIISI
jgi:hypothetical protein